MASYSGKIGGSVVAGSGLLPESVIGSSGCRTGGVSGVSSYESPGAAGVGSKHHLVNSGLGTCFGCVNFSVQVSFGIIVHWCSGFSLGTRRVMNRQVFWGFRSQTSSGTSTSEAITLSWHSSAPSWKTQPAPQISTGNFSHFVSPTNFPGCFSTYFVEQDDSYTVRHSSGPVPSQTFSVGL